MQIEALAKRRLADEYDAAQERGEVQRHGGQGKRDVPEENIPSVVDLGLTRKQVHEARQIRNAEAVAPGVIRRALDERLSHGQEPTKAAAVLAHAYAVEVLVREGVTGPQKRNAVKTAILLAPV